MGVIAILPSNVEVDEIEVISLVAGADISSSDTLGVFPLPGTPHPPADNVFINRMQNGKLLVSCSADYPWGYSTVYFAILDINAGFEFDVAIPTIDDTMEDGYASVVCLPDNSVLFKTLHKVFRWNYKSATIDEVINTTDTQYINLFYDGSGFGRWNPGAEQLIIYDTAGGDISFRQAPADTRIWAQNGPVDPFAMPYRSGAGPIYTYGVYNMYDDVYTPLYSSNDPGVYLRAYPDATGTTAFLYNNGDIVTVYRFVDGVLAYSVSGAAAGLTFSDGYDNTPGNGTLALTEAAGGV